MKLALYITAMLAAFGLPQAAFAMDGHADMAHEASGPHAPLFAAEMELAKNFVDSMMANGVVVPVPKDPGGGYTHEQHKRNFRSIYQGGQLYRITGDEKYRDYVRDVLLEYAQLYPTLGDHPERHDQYSGRIFWQVLNDAMWLVHAVQGYGDIRDSLTASDRQRIDDNVFRKAAHFLSVESVDTFDRIHNHATWATAGVGMTGYLLGDDDMVERALMGSDKSGKAGFLRQADMLFSPDGYYTEGPYYQRFALLPFMVFADRVESNQPERAIWEHRDGILLKALRTTVQLSYQGYFFPFNDAIRDKSLRTAELYEGVAIAYAQTRDPSLLAVAEFQGRTVLTPNGAMVAKDLDAGLAKPFAFRSLLLSDGPDGDEGAVAILRQGEGPRHTALVAKNASQGMGHGHFDKLAWQLYDNGNEIVRDYGAARFLNIVAKRGGRYLPENTTWAKSSIAHNTLVVDEQSHFGGNVRVASQNAPQQLYFSDAQGLQVTSAHIDSAYPGVTMSRTLLMPQIPGLEAPLVIDLVHAQSEGEHTYDLPLHYSGHIMEYDFETPDNVVRNVAGRPVLGSDNGYQHIWVDAKAALEGGKGALTWILDGRFYTYRFAGNGPLTAMLGESGANDPEFNLRREPLLLLRANRASNASFASLLEAHGSYDGAAEQTLNSRSLVADLDHVRLEGNDIITLTLKSGQRFAIAVSHNSDPGQSHVVTMGDEAIAWDGFAAVVALRGEGDE